MEQQENLHASIPPALLIEVEKVAAEKRVTMDELVQEAVGRIVAHTKEPNKERESQPSAHLAEALCAHESAIPPVPQTVAQTFK